jgi:hypothetical protein
MNKGMQIRRRKDTKPSKRALHWVLAHKHPRTARTAKSKGIRAAGVWRTFRSPARNVGIKDTSQSTARIPVAVVDQGREIARASANASGRVWIFRKEITHEEIGMWLN